MAEATTQLTVTPKEMGKHLRSIRRRKGLSLAEVARGAGLSRRELVAYERGKVPIPESDLWVLAGSCGVDVGELVPSTSPSNELAVITTPTSIGDTVSQLRKSHQDPGIAPYLHTLHKLQALPPGKRIPVKDRELDAIAGALGSTPRSIDAKLQEVLQVSPDEAERLRTMILRPPSGRGKPRALAAATPAEPSVGAPVATPLLTSAPPAPPVFSASAPAPDPASAPPTVPAPAPTATGEPDELLQTLPVAPAAFLDTPLDAPVDPVHGHNVDVFEELARLPEPLPLGDPSAPLPDLLAPPAAFAEVVPLVAAPYAGLPDGAVELVDGTMSAPAPAVRSGTDVAPAWNAVDAPPIDVAARQGSSTWDLGEHLTPPAPPASDEAWTTGGWQPPAPSDGTTTTPVGFWEGTDNWSPAEEREPTDETLDAIPMPDSPSGPLVIGDDTWAGTAWQANPWTPAEPTPWPDPEWPAADTDEGAWDHRPDPAAVDSGFFVDWGTPDTETPRSLEAFAEVVTPDASSSPWTDAAPVPDPADDPASGPTAFDAYGTVAPVFDETLGGSADDATRPCDAASGGATQGMPEIFEVDTVDPTPYATNGFDTTVFETSRFDPDGFESIGHGGPSETTADETTPYETTPYETTPYETFPYETATHDEAPPAWDLDAPFVADGPAADADLDPATEDDAAATTELVPISWRATEAVIEPRVDDVPITVDLAESEPPESAVPETVLPAAAAIAAPMVEAALPQVPPTYETPLTPVAPDDTTLVEEFATAGPDWRLGNALPLVEVQSQGALVMRRADERWALADVTTAPNFVAEVDVDFRSGPGFGVLFCASVDHEGRMSGYSFDIDPIYDGGGYLVRQWQADRELWNPIARVGGTDPSSMYGKLTVRLVVTGNHVTARVNGVEVLVVDDLEAASQERGRDAATGDRVGVQAWSSSDLVIDTLRVAAH